MPGNPALLNTTCKPLTDFDIAKEKLRQEQEERQSNHQKEKSLRN